MDDVSTKVLTTGDMRANNWLPPRRNYSTMKMFVQLPFRIHRCRPIVVHTSAPCSRSKSRRMILGVFMHNFLLLERKKYL